jgi:hypothetical protein
MKQGCICEGPNKRENWRVRQYKCNHSAFNGYRYTPSDYSSIHCLECGRAWRTKAKYVDEIQIAEFRR